ncbi:hypothetical protein [Janibacter terrae]|uniref:hypothetical protein n=1 Tax=Janibacter terrae TaxID=103817 RepID=UPI0031F8294A
MTDRHDTPRGPDDDELVRAALMELMDDVGAHPLPEPSAVRARAEVDGASFTPDDMRHLARAVLGEVDLTQEPCPPATPSSAATGAAADHPGRTTPTREQGGSTGSALWETG